MLGVFVLTLFAALSWTLLFAYLLYGGLNIVTSIVAAMLIGLYVDYMILAYHRFDGELRGGRSAAAGAGGHLLRHRESAPQQRGDERGRLLFRGRDRFPGTP